MAPMKIVVWGKIHESGLASLRSDPSVSVTEVDPTAEGAIEPHLADTEALLIRTSLLPANLIERAANLKVVSRYGVGYDNIDVAALTKRRIPLTVIGNENAVSVAEHTLYLMLAAAKAGLPHDRATRQGNWRFRDTQSATDLMGKEVLIVGLGRIGQKVGKLCEALGMIVKFFDPQVDARALGVSWPQRTDLIAGLRAADVVTLHVPLLPATRGLIGEFELAAMKSTAIIVSTARGGVLDEAALARALVNGSIRAAALDVFETEPVASDNPLLTLDNVVLSPHVASLTSEGTERMALAAARNCLDGLRGHLDRAYVVNAEVLSS